MSSVFDTKIEFLKGVGPQRAEILQKELQIFTFGDLLQHYPFRYEDRRKFYTIAEVHENLPYIQLKGQFYHFQTQGEGGKKRLTATFRDGTGEIEVVWFKGQQWVLKKIQPGVTYVLFGKPNRYGSKLNVAHPELDLLNQANERGGYLQPVYRTTEKLKTKFIDSKAISKMVEGVLQSVGGKIPETLPKDMMERLALMPKYEALRQLHFPTDEALVERARFRMKFEELFYVQMRLFKMKLARTDKFRGQVFQDTTLLTRFYQDHLPFELTNAQKRVVKEIYADLKKGQQMNRLLQGDVGSGKTMVAFLSMLLVVAEGAQAAIMAPTEILSEQHYRGLLPFAEQMGLSIALLTGSTKKKRRAEIHQGLLDGSIHLLIGTHALLEDVVQFKNLGLCVIDEQHRFGVAQRAKLWGKNKEYYPHVLVMTATPIPRTLAMTLYGDLDVSVIDELPSGRKPIETKHYYEKDRLRIFGFIKKEIEKGRQVYIVYPLIEESEKLLAQTNKDIKNLLEGYESISRAFPQYHLSIVHGGQKAEDKEFEMKRFVKGETQIMVATTVIEVGVNVPNASVMIIENADRFGLSQLHQLRGRVGRGAEQSYCILMTDYKLSKEARTRIETMVRTNNGFEIADVDLRLRGPGDLMGTQQSGLTDLMIADLSQDGKIVQLSREFAQELMALDPELDMSQHQMVKQQIAAQKKHSVNWSRIS